jgi:1,4-dihydroxy-2-naphthoate octaprenyltransferase
MVAVCAYLVFREGRAFMVVIAAIAAHLFWMYSFPPFRLSYRGYGEVLQGIGLGVLLPVAGFYVQAGTLSGLHPATLLPGFLLGFAAKRDGGARQRPVRRGVRQADNAGAKRRARLAANQSARDRRGGADDAARRPFGGHLRWGLAIAVSGAALIRAARLSRDAESIDRVRCERFTGATLAAIAIVILCWSGALVFGATKNRAPRPRVALWWRVPLGFFRDRGEAPEGVLSRQPGLA